MELNVGLKHKLLSSFLLEVPLDFESTFALAHTHTRTANVLCNSIHTQVLSKRTEINKDGQDTKSFTTHLPSS